MFLVRISDTKQCVIMALDRCCYTNPLGLCYLDFVHSWQLSFLLVIPFLPNGSFQVGPAGVWREKTRGNHAK